MCAIKFPWLTLRQRRMAVKRWSAELLAVLGIDLHVRGTPPPDDARPVMLVANHVSWLDIFSINAVVPARFVAKSEIRRWPFIGWLCAQAGTIFIRQARRHDTVRVNAEVSAALSAGDVFAVFPEGTTSDGSNVAKFHSSLLEPALAAGAAVQPVAIRYEREDGTLCTEVAYDGDTTLWETIRAMTTQPSIAVHLRFLPPAIAAGRHRRELAREAREAILRTLFPGARDTRTDKDSGPRA